MALSPNHKKLIASILILSAAALVYRYLNYQKIEQTAALFIGLPAFLAIAFSFVKTESAMGFMFKGVTVALFMSATVLHEGFICILMAAPLFYAIGLIVVVAMKKHPKNAVRCVAIVILLPMSMEGLREEWSFGRDETVTRTRIVERGSVELFQRLSLPFDFKSELPMYLRMGFPRPKWIKGEGLEVGDRRVIHFAGGEGKPGNLELEVESVEEGRVVFRMIKDESHIAHWLDWNRAIAEWQELPSGQTELKWTFQFTRLLDPAWYFKPFERYAVGLAADYLLTQWGG